MSPSDQLETTIADDTDIEAIIELCALAREHADRLGLDVTVHLLDMALFEMIFVAGGPRQGRLN
jgi:hypothetical protein